ncbi:MAG: diaminopimelate epimerase [Betaproteobacteria bacterium]|nr:diaminopimelate epimerase [Betaproteobacteria bacterium]
MPLHFAKMHGAGNDFVVIDATREPFTLQPQQLRLLADRHFGVGADQILVVEASPDPDVDFRYRIFNADGGEVEQCGNGARCFVAFVRRRGLTSKRSVRVLTRSGIIEPRMEEDGRVCVDMGAPRLLPSEVPFDTAGLRATAEGDMDRWELVVDDQPLRLSVVSMGNPHAVQLVDDVDTAPVARLGPLIENHPRFAQRVNAGFLQVLDPHHARLRVWERGAGETLACGTGACAAAVAGMRHGWLRNPVHVQARGGALSISWDGPGRPVLMTGPAVHVFDASIDLDALPRPPATLSGTP